MSFNNNPIREKLHSLIDTLTDQELHMVDWFIAEIKPDDSVVNESTEAYVKTPAVKTASQNAGSEEYYTHDEFKEIFMSKLGAAYGVNMNDV